MLRQLIRRNPTAAHPQIPTRGTHSTARSLRYASQRVQLIQTRSPLSKALNTRQCAFHSTPNRQAGPLVPIFAALLKASTSLELTRTAGRIALTLVPAILMTNLKTRKHIKYAALHGIPHPEESKARLLKNIRYRKWLLYGLLFVPGSLFWATIIASLEQTPLTGRWRLIILSPEEEEEIAAQLAGPGWYKAVSEILNHDGPARIIPNTDWRSLLCMRNGPWKTKIVLPCLQQPNILSAPGPVQANIFEECPPYSLLIVDKPDASNAFSYGFGPDGGGGIVVYSGFLNDVLAKAPIKMSNPPTEEKPWWSWLLGSIFQSSPPPPSHPTPTPEQTSELAILLAHELAHLVLSHHLESLSSATVIMPGTISILADVVRVVIFPITMLFGPFVNDAVAQLGRIGSGELVKVGEYCTSVKQEIEADVVSARLLAHAGFDARDAVRFWEDRSGSISECARTDGSEDPWAKQTSHHLARRIMGSSHPVTELRVERLKEELARWESERLATVSRLRAVAQGQASSP
ncbi:Metalloendopeptidase OMA1, mitochondrial [Hypsizygus marmoreus]|uniref:Metalloendopeptidase OMA1, mitochondrial n=1 Tax=Hypsizygus marmoreus TaxID=39966 RepID=A0A369K385_HYPMA|nr:Metalloendopeptidase OMA1, mitochondrial [Hypsizygus marmoreus]